MPRTLQIHRVSMGVYFADTGRAILQGFLFCRGLVLGKDPAELTTFPIQMSLRLLLVQGGAGRAFKSTKSSFWDNFGRGLLQVCQRRGEPLSTASANKICSFARLAQHIATLIVDLGGAWIHCKGDVWRSSRETPGVGTLPESRFAGPSGFVLVGSIVQSKLLGPLGPNDTLYVTQ